MAEDFLKLLFECKSIYDLAACAYYIVCETDEVKVCTDAFSSPKKRGCIFKEYNNIFVAYPPYFDQNFSRIRLEFYSLIIKYTKEDLCMHCAYFIQALDVNMINVKPTGLIYSGCIPSVGEKGPLNKAMLCKEIAVYTHVKSILLDAFLQNGEQSKLRRIGEASGDSINAILNLKHLILVKEKDLGKYSSGVSTVTYNDYGRLESILKNRKSLKVGFSPISIVEPYNIVYNNNKFEIDGLKPEQEKEILKRYIQALCEMEQDGVNIAVFPEAFLTDVILEELKKHQKASAGGSCNLIVCGSVWKNNANEVVVLTSTGEELIRNRRYAPFLLKTEQGDQYYENIIQGNERRMSFIDIDGLGRLAVYICKDFISVNKLAATTLAVNVTTIVSATGSMDEFRNDAKYLAQRQNNIVLFNNTCCELKDRIRELNEADLIEVGFAGVPCKLKDTNGVDIWGYHAKRSCANKCSSQGCYHLFSLNLDVDEVEVSEMHDTEVLRKMTMQDAKEWKKKASKDYLVFRLKHSMEHRPFEVS